LRVELAIVTNRPFIIKVEMFRLADAGAVALLALLMAHQTHTPDENILFEGELNTSLFFVRSGDLRVFVYGGLDKKSFSTKCKGVGAARLAADAPPVFEEAKDAVRGAVGAESAKDGGGGCRGENGADVAETDEGSAGNASEGSSAPIDVSQSVLATAGAVSKSLANGGSGCVKTSEWARLHFTAKPSTQSHPNEADVSDRRQLRRSCSVGFACNSKSLRPVRRRSTSCGGGSPLGLRHMGTGTIAPLSFLHRRDVRETKAPREAKESAHDASSGAVSERQSRSFAKPRLKRDNTATLALRSVVRQVVAINREIADEAEEARLRVQEIKSASMLDIAQLGHVVGRLHDGAAFGEQSFLSGKPAMSTVRTVSFCEIMSLNRNGARRGKHRLAPMEPVRPTAPIGS
jgi:hypothetical protein